MGRLCGGAKGVAVQRVLGRSGNESIISFPVATT